jgi:hypothetical protein
MQLTKNDFLPTGLAIGIGIMAQFVPQLLSHREATAEAGYWLFGSFPAMVILSGVLAFLFPAHSFLWAFVIIAADFCTGLATLQGESNLMPIGVVLYAIYLLPCFLLSWIGNYVRRKLTVLGQ